MWTKTEGRDFATVNPEDVYRRVVIIMRVENYLNKVNDINKSTLHYIAYRLTGKAGVDFSVGCRTMALDLKNRCWSKEILEYAGIGCGVYSSWYRWRSDKRKYP